MMKPRERVFAVLQHRKPDRVPRFEIWIDALLDELGQGDPAGAYVNLGQDCMMISPRMWREFVLPYHRRIVAALGVPMIWHSDGNVESLLPMAIEAGFIGFHGLDPMAGMDLVKIKLE